MPRDGVNQGLVAQTSRALRTRGEELNSALALAASSIRYAAGSLGYTVEEIVADTGLSQRAVENIIGGEWWPEPKATRRTRATRK